MGWQKAEFAAEVQRIAADGGNDADRAALATILHGELPVLPIAWYQQKAAVSKTVKGIVIDPYERTLGLKSAEFVE